MLEAVVTPIATNQNAVFFAVQIVIVCRERNDGQGSGARMMDERASDRWRWLGIRTHKPRLDHLTILIGEKKRASQSNVRRGEGRRAAIARIINIGVGGRIECFDGYFDAVVCLANSRNRQLERRATGNIGLFGCCKAFELPMRRTIENAAVGNVWTYVCRIMDRIDKVAIRVPQIECASVVVVERKVRVLPMVVAPVATDKCMALSRNILEVVDGIG